MDPRNYFQNMKMLKLLTIFPLIITLFTFAPAQTQSPAERFKAAQEAFDASDYEKTLTLLNAMEKDFGKNPRVESLRALALRDLNRPKEAYESLLVYFQLTAKMDLRNNEAHQSLAQLRDELKAQLEGELNNEKQKLLDERNKNAEKTIAESSKQATQPAKSDPLAEIEMWNKVRESNNAADFYLFIERFPKSVYVKSAREKMNALGDGEWDKVKNSKDPFALRDYLKNNPNSAFAEQAKARMNMLAESIIEWERIRESKEVTDIDSYIKNFPEGANIEVAIKIRNDLARERNTKRASELYQSYLDYDKKFNTDLQAAMKRNNGGEGLYPQWDTTWAINTLTRVINLNPKHADAYQARGSQYQVYLKNYTAALEDYNKAIELEPTANKFWGRAEIYKELKMRSEAINDYEATINGNYPSTWSRAIIEEREQDIYNSLAELLIESRQYERAVAIITRYIETRQNVIFWFYRMRAESYDKLGRKDLAKADRKKCKELNQYC